jgi:hypothetical protein
MERTMDFFFFFFRKYTGSFNFFFCIILILFNLTWHPKTQVPRRMVP